MYVANAGNGSVHHIEGSRAPRLTAAGVVNAASLPAGWWRVAGDGVRPQACATMLERCGGPGTAAEHAGRVSVTVAELRRLCIH